MLTPLSPVTNVRVFESLDNCPPAIQPSEKAICVVPSGYTPVSSIVAPASFAYTLGLVESLLINVTVFSDTASLTVISRPVTLTSSLFPTTDTTPLLIENLISGALA